MNQANGDRNPLEEVFGPRIIIDRRLLIVQYRPQSRLADVGLLTHSSLNSMARSVPHPFGPFFLRIQAKGIAAWSNWANGLSAMYLRAYRQLSKVERIIERAELLVGAEGNNKTSAGSRIRDLRCFV